MGEAPGTGRELSSWTEIAAHLGVSVRTAQVWEKECALPIHRLPGRNRVLAHTTALDGWKLLRNNHAPSIVGSPSWWPGWPAVAIVGVLFLLLGFIVADPRSYHAAPFALRADPTGFTVVDDAGRPLWTKTFPTGISTQSWCPGFPGIIADIDGDGKNEVLFIPNPPVEVPAPVPLFCYNADGSERWRFTPGRAVKTQSSTFPPEFKACSITILPNTTGARIALGSFHRMYYPYQLAFLTARGKLLREYWHPGHVQAVALHDIDRDGSPELLLGGINNARRQATLVAIDPNTTNGAATEHDPAYQFQGLPTTTGKARLFFARSTINDRDPYNRATRIDAGNDGITVHVTEQFGYQPATVFYHLNNNLSLRDLSFSDVFTTRTRQASANIDGEIARLRAVIKE